MRDVEVGEGKGGVHSGDELEKRDVVERHVEASGAMWSVREVEGMYHVVVCEELQQLRECMRDRKVDNTISPTVENLEVDKSAAPFGKSGNLIPNENELLERSQPANLFRELRDHIERYVEVPKGGHLANDRRKTGKFVVGNVQRLEHAKSGKVPRKLFHAVVLQLENAQFGDTVEPGVVKINNAVT